MLTTRRTTNSGIEILRTVVKNNLFLISFSVFYYGIIIFLAGYLNIWEDEFYSLNTSSKTLSYAYHQSNFFELQPPSYFLLLTIWRSISDSILWARMLNVLFIIITQILIYIFFTKITEKKKAVFLSVLFLLNPTIVYFLLEIRLPALLILLSAGATILFFNTYYCNNISHIKRIIFVLIAITGLFTQFYFGFLLFANALVLLINGKKRTFWLYIIDMIIPLCLVLLSIPQIMRSADVHAVASPVYNRIGLDFLNEIRILTSQITFGYFMPLDFLTIGIWKWIFRASFILLFSILIFRLRKKPEFHNFFSFLLISIIVYLFFVLVTFQFGKYSVLLPKYTIIIFVPIFISIVLLLLHAGNRLFYIFVFLLSIIYSTQNFKRYDELYKHHDFKSLGNYIKQDEEPGQDIFVYNNIKSDVLKIYYNGINKIYPILEPFSFQSEYSPEKWLLTKNDVHELGERIKGYDIFYIVVFENEHPEFLEFHKYLTHFFSTNYKIEEEKYFKNYTFLYKISAKNNLD